MNKFVAVLTMLTVFAVAEVAKAQSAFFNYHFRSPTAAEVANDGTLAGRRIYNYFITTTSDILQFDSVRISGFGLLIPIYQNAFGADSEAPNPGFVTVFPALGADSYITTPGATSIAGAGFGSPASAWFDTSNDGPVSNFLFAQLTTAGNALGRFNGKVQLQNANGPVIVPFRLLIGNIPEPSGLVLSSTLLCCALFARFPRRLSHE